MSGRKTFNLKNSRQMCEELSGKLDGICYNGGVNLILVNHSTIITQRKTAFVVSLLIRTYLEGVVLSYSVEHPNAQL